MVSSTIGVAIISAVLAVEVPRFLASSAPDVEVVNIAVIDASQSLAAPTLDIKLRNIGNQVSVLTRVDLTVRQYGELIVCGGGGSLEPSTSYPLSLPVPARIGEVASANISEDLDPNTADRFDVKVGLGSGVLRKDPFREYTYVVDVKIAHDSSSQEIDAGTAALIIPAGIQLAQEPNYSSYVPPPGVNLKSSQWEPVASCYTNNIAILRGLRRSKGALPPKLTDTPLS